MAVPSLGIGLILVAFLPVVAQLPCLLFCWHQLPQLLPLSLRRHASRAERKRRAEFRRASAPKQQPNPNWAQNYQEPRREAPTATSALCAAERIRNTGPRVPLLLEVQGLLLLLHRSYQ